jgi:hypothetical protein
MKQAHGYHIKKKNPGIGDINEILKMKVFMIRLYGGKFLI